MGATAAHSQQSATPHDLGDVHVQSSDLLSTNLRDDWPSYNGDYTGKRYSSLTQVTPENAHQLRAQWVFHSRNVGVLEVTPVVVAGVMFVTASNDAYALDAATGKTLWHHARQVTPGLVDDASGHINRGVAVLGNRIYMETDNAHLLCLDARSGNLIWDVPYAFDNRNYGATSAPLVVKDKVLVGTSGGDDGVRGFIAAFDAKTGKEVWRFWTIPAPGEFGSSSWPGKTYLNGGGTTWMPGTYDPKLNTIYWGTSNPSPDFDGSVRPGDDLYTNCVLALDPDTGKLKWYFQFTPHDLYDYDATETPVLVDAIYHGHPRKLLIEANRNGFIYVLDRTDGKFLEAKQFAIRQNWAKGIDANGRPIRTGNIPTPEGTRICPGYAGATNWFSPSYNDFTHLFYFLTLDDCNVYSSSTQPFEEGRPYYSTGVKHLPDENAKKYLLAYDPNKGEFAWRYPLVGDAHSFAGVMTTATGLVAFGDDAEEFEIVNGHTGTPLWHFNVGQPLHASPMSYAVNGKQYFAIAAGSDLFSFALP
ncbi:MAG: PQQ-binding-like beta-propeller repeat protein [Edaphobacter sp.]